MSVLSISSDSSSLDTPSSCVNSLPFVSETESTKACNSSSGDSDFTSSCGSLVVFSSSVSEPRNSRLKQNLTMVFFYDIIPEYFSEDDVDEEASISVLFVLSNDFDGVPVDTIMVEQLV